MNFMHHVTGRSMPVLVLVLCVFTIGLSKSSRADCFPVDTLMGQWGSGFLGYSVSGAGDVNNDGFADIIVGAPGSLYGNDSGAAYVYSAQTDTLLYTFLGEADNNNLGYSVSGAGDVNNDGFDDVIVGAPYNSAGGTDAGRAYVFSGQDGSILHLFTCDSAYFYFGWSVSGAGDVNNDGFADIIVGAHEYNAMYHMGKGHAYVFSGLSGGMIHHFTDPGGPGNKFGWSVSGAGDVNNDGFDDLVVGAPFWDDPYHRSGWAFVYSGSSGAILYIFKGEDWADELGSCVSGAGDVNGDGFGDVVIGVPYAGCAYVYSGQTGTRLWTVGGGYCVSGAGDVNNDGFGDVVVTTGTEARVYSGPGGNLLQELTIEGSTIKAVSGAGDVNNDGFDDLILGAPLHEDGRAYLFTCGSPAVLVHGWHGSIATWGGTDPHNLKSLLEAEGWMVKYFTYPSENLTDWDVPIETLAGQLNDSLETWCDRLIIGKVNIIAHSMGGLISRYLLAHPEAFTSAGKVQRLVTLGTPNYGAASALWLDLLGTLQGTQQEFGSDFLWDLHEDWQEASPQAQLLCIAGAQNDYTDPHDGLVLLPSACLENLGHPSCYISNPHTGEDGMAYIKDVNHPSYVAIKSFLLGEIPPSNEENVSGLTEGMLIAGLFDPNGDSIPVGTIPFIGRPRVWWDPDPTLYWEWTWWPWLSSLGHGVNSESGKYYATGADPGTYKIRIDPTGGYSPIVIQSVTIEPRQTRILSLTVYPANDSANASFVSGDTPPVTLGNTGVTMDFSSGPGGNVWVYRFDDNPPDADGATMPHYWDIITDMLDDSFSVTMTFDYNEAETLAAGISEDELVLAYCDSLWHPMPSVVDTVADKISTITTHFTLFTIGDFKAAATLCGDANSDESVNMLDILHLIAYLYKGGPAPDSLDSADVNNDGSVNMLDILYLIAYLYKGGPEPVCP